MSSFDWPCLPNNFFSSRWYLRVGIWQPKIQLGSLATTIPFFVFVSLHLQSTSHQQPCPSNNPDTVLDFDLAISSRCLGPKAIFFIGHFAPSVR
uniref:Uncharacterized protein n=1 Tax=Rhizophora mucronata TaxID=61149 RepID=A0A2P2ME06_RHIMU